MAPPDTDTKPRDDGEIAQIRAARAGDPDAFCRLVKPYLPALRARVRYAVRNRTEIDPEEIVQDTLLRSYQSLAVFDERHTFGQYLFGIARYAILRQAAARRREIAVAWQEAGDSPASGATVLPGADEIPETFAAFAGAARFPTPDARVRARHRFHLLLSAFLAHGGYPHQQIAFGFSVMLYGKAKAKGDLHAAGPRTRADKVDVTGDPDRVVRELSRTSLEDSGNELRTELEGREVILPQDMDEAFRPFLYRMGMTGAALFARDPTSRAQFADLAGTRIGGTHLESYYGKDPRRSVADWSKAVKTRVRRYLSGELDRTRSPLPMPGEDRQLSVTHDPAS
jgi:DNA-directed RNA polymerase specialized sigma24 family protein